MFGVAKSRTLAIALAVGGLTQCQGSEENDCSPGYEGCACVMNLCFGELQCLSSICVDANGSSASQGPTSNASDPSGTTGPATSNSSDPTGDPTTGITTAPTTGPTTTGGPTTDDPTATTGEDTTTTATTTTTSTTDATTSTTDPPGMESQPANGLYADCVNKACDQSTDGCFELTSQGGQILDAYCSNVCTEFSDCLPKPSADATPACIDFGDANVCALLCVVTEDCPLGMTCRATQTANGSANFCW